jgi:proteasome accessory factor C
MLYVIAYCASGEGIRVFRMDRLEGAEVLDERFEPVPGFSPDEVLREGRVFHAPGAGTMRVRYSPRIARWIAEREGRVPAADGSLVLEHPLADREWAMRHVLQYGADAEVLSPVELREAMQERLRAMA